MDKHVPDTDYREASYLKGLWSWNAFSDILRGRRCRFGFPIAFLDRQRVLEILFQSYPEPDRIRLSDRVTTTENTGNGVTITTENGKAYYGHLVVGADGTHSQVRSEIWRAAERDSPGLIRAREKDSEWIGSHG